MHLIISIKEPQQISVQLFDIEGRAVSQARVFDCHSNGVNILNFNCKNIANGIYMLKIRLYLEIL